MSKVVEISNFDEYNDFKNDHSRIVIFYGAKWCKGCTELMPMYIRIANRYHNRIAMGHVDVDECKLDFEEVPVFVSMYKGNQINSIVGADNEELKRFVKEAIQYKIPPVHDDNNHQHNHKCEHGSDHDNKPVKEYENKHEDKPVRVNRDKPVKEHEYKHEDKPVRVNRNKLVKEYENKHEDKPVRVNRDKPVKEHGDKQRSYHYDEEDDFPRGRLSKFMREDGREDMKRENPKMKKREKPLGDKRKDEYPETKYYEEPNKYDSSDSYPDVGSYKSEPYKYKSFNHNNYIGMDNHKNIVSQGLTDASNRGNFRENNMFWNTYGTSNFKGKEGASMKISIIDEMRKNL